MPNELSEKVRTTLSSSSDAVVDAWLEALPSSIAHQIDPATLRRELSDLYGAFARQAQGGPAAAAAEDELRALVSELSADRARSGSTPTETALSVLALKTALRVVVEPEQMEDALALDAVVDELALMTFERFVAAREAIIVRQLDQITELATPVVQLWEGVLAVPLVGTLDSARTQVVMETLLERLVATSSKHAILDITGVPTVDTQVAQHLLKTVMAARLMGAEVILSGIRPQIAQTVVALGIEFGDIPTKATMADALRHVLHLSGYDIERSAPHA